MLYTSQTVEKGSAELKKNANTALVGATLIQFMVLANAVVSRFSHAGRVCSGDYLGFNDPTTGYLVDQGSFLKTFPLLCLMTTLGISVFAMFAVMGKFTFRKFIEEE